MTASRKVRKIGAMSATLQDLPTFREAAPFVVRTPAVQTAPLVFASAHSGRAYPAELLAESRLDPQMLRRSEDSFVDELFGAAPELGAPLLAATFPRAWCDANREPWELDPAMFADRLPAFCNTASGRVRAGFGTIARIVAEGAPIYRRKLRFSEAERRIAGCWQPYHDALSGLIATTRERFGCCLVIDCHSMPSEQGQRVPVGSGRRGAATIVLGDVHGMSCAPGLTAHVETWLEARGHAVRRNDPYAGGYVARHYGRPGAGVHVLQIEISRALYMDEARNLRGPGFEALRVDMTGLIAALAERRDLLGA